MWTLPNCRETWNNMKIVLVVPKIHSAVRYDIVTSRHPACSSFCIPNLAVIPKYAQINKIASSHNMMRYRHMDECGVRPDCQNVLKHDKFDTWHHEVIGKALVIQDFYKDLQNTLWGPRGHEFWNPDEENCGFLTLKISPMMRNNRKLKIRAFYW